MKKKGKKRCVTLIEIMVVIMLISLIGGALAFNMRGSMDKGRAFKTEQNISRIEDILTLTIAESGKNASDILLSWSQIVTDSPLVKDDSILKDGWNGEIKVAANGETGFTVTSDKLDEYYKKHKITIK